MSCETWTSPLQDLPLKFSKAIGELVICMNQVVDGVESFTTKICISHPGSHFDYKRREVERQQLLVMQLNKDYDDRRRGETVSQTPVGWSCGQLTFKRATSVPTDAIVAPRLDLQNLIMAKVRDDTGL